MKKVISIVLNNFKNDSRVLKENISLQKVGFDVTVIALHDPGQEEFETVANIPVHRVKLKSREWSKNKIVQLFKYFEFLYRVIKKYRYADIVHCNDLNALPIGVLIKLLNKDTRIVYDAHEFEINDKPNENPLSIKLKYYLEKFLIKYANRVITVSDSIANEYSKLYGIKKPALVLNTPPFKRIEKKDILREKLGIEKDKTIFLYQGGLSSGRGIEILLEAFKQIRDNKSVIVFMGYGPLEGMVKEASREYENIYFHEAVAPNILLDFTSSADFGILFYENNCLNHNYCSPNKMFEYLMAEIPVIASNLYEMKKLVETHNIGIVAKENTPEGLREAIQKSLTLDRQELEVHIQKVKKIYNWEEQERVLCNLYRELL